MLNVVKIAKIQRERKASQERMAREQEADRLFSFNIESDRNIIPSCSKLCKCGNTCGK